MLERIEINSLNEKYREDFNRLLGQGFPPEWASIIINIDVLLNFMEVSSFLNQQDCDVINKLIQDLFDQRHKDILTAPTSTSN